jgi:cytochrome P450
VEHDVVTLNVSQIQGSNSILTSIFKEVLRYHGIGTFIRVVTQDHLLDGTYLLKKGGIVMIHGAVQHTSVPAYGENAQDFQHNRFVRSPGVKRPSPVAFRGFGGGSALCPGRHFASTEVLAFVALMIARFEFEPTKGSWITPKTDSSGAHGTVAPPDTDVEVSISPRVSELADKKWLVVVSEITENVQLSVENISLA